MHKDVRDVPLPLGSRALLYGGSACEEPVTVLKNGKSAEGFYTEVLFANGETERVSRRCLAPLREVHRAVAEIGGEAFDFASLDGETYVGTSKAAELSDHDALVHLMDRPVLKVTRRWLDQLGALFSVVR